MGPILACGTLGVRRVQRSTLGAGRVRSQELARVGGMVRIRVGAVSASSIPVLSPSLAVPSPELVSTFPLCPVL